ncbi:MAG: transketolase [Candidatus Magasanikbacteria bacterium]
MHIPKLISKLNKDQIDFLNVFSKSCRHSILQMTTNAGSGHPGGSLSCVDYLSILYAFVISKTGDPVIVSNGHISPAVYSILAEMGYVSKKDAIKNFRKFGSKFEGHVTRHVPGVWYGTGPLGCGVSAASGFALAQKIKNQKGIVYGLIGDGESQEGQVYEMMNFAAKYELDNFVVFMDYNEVQLSDSLKKVMPLDPKAHFEAAGWIVIEIDGHDYQNIWSALGKAGKIKNKPALILGHTVMGKGSVLMEKEGQIKHATWHGKAATVEQIEKDLHLLRLTEKEEARLSDFRKSVSWKPKKTDVVPNIKTGTPIEYKKGEVVDCRSAYGKALLSLAQKNEQIIALTADLASSVRTDYVKDAYPARHIDCGIAEQQMVSCSGGLSFSGLVPFCSTFGAFMTSRAKDQARVNDINETNVKMVATHCGLSVGEDGPTHQAIDDIGSMAGLLNTKVIEPADPNHCDRIIRYAAREKGNFYVRMGRHKVPVLMKENGSLLYDKNYKYEYGRCDLLRAGKDVTIAASGATVHEALKSYEILKEKGISAEIVVLSSPKKFDKTLFQSVKKTNRLITVEDHVVESGFGSQIAREIQERDIHLSSFTMLGVREYQLSGKWEELYKAAGIDASAIVRAAQKR